MCGWEKSLSFNHFCGSWVWRNYRGSLDWWLENLSTASSASIEV